MSSSIMDSIANGDTSLQQIAADTNQIKGWQYLFPERGRGGSAKEKVAVGMVILPYINAVKEKQAEREDLGRRLVMSLYVANILLFLKDNDFDSASAELVEKVLTAANIRRDLFTPKSDAKDELGIRRVIGDIMGGCLFHLSDEEKEQRSGREKNRRYYTIPNMADIKELCAASIKRLKELGIEN